MEAQCCTTSTKEEQKQKKNKNTELSLTAVALLCVILNVIARKGFVELRIVFFRHKILKTIKCFFGNLFATFPGLILFIANAIFINRLAIRVGRTISETLEFPKKFTIFGNLALALWIALDTVAFLIVNITAGIVFLLVALIAVYGVLKFLGCLRPCYNCRKCTFGLGRLSALYFGKRNLKDYKLTYRLPTAIFFYVLIGPFPAAFLLISSVQTFSILKIIVFIVLVMFLLYSALT
jgi:hypothetical protein